MGRLLRKLVPEAPPKAAEPEPVFYDRGASMTSARAHFAGGRLDAAEDVFKDVLAQDPNDIEALRGLAEVSEKKGFRRNAILVYNKLLALNPQDEDARAKLKTLMASG